MTSLSPSPDQLPEARLPPIPWGWFSAGILGFAVAATIGANVGSWPAFFVASGVVLVGGAILAGRQAGSRGVGLFLVGMVLAPIAAAILFYAFCLILLGAWGGR